MTFCYHNIVDPAAPDAVTSYLLTDNNIPPLLVLWLLVTTNNAFWNAPGTPGSLNDAARQNISNKLGITKYTVDYIINLANLNSDTFSDVNTLFSTLANAAGYTGTGCPRGPTPILGLAPSAQVENPGE
jgi:hypothetical protein